MREKLEKILTEIVQELNDNKIKFCEDLSILDCLENDIFLDIKRNYKKILIVGMGASLFNIKSILSSIKLENYLFDVDFLDTIDEEAVNYKLKALAKDTKVIFITHSGNTTEIIILYKHIKSILKEDFNPLLFCSNENSELCKLINDDFLDSNSKIFKCSRFISTSGRFGAFSFCNLFIAKLIGVEVKKLLLSATKYIQTIQNYNSDDFKDLASETKWIIENYNLNRKIFVNFYYSDRLEGLMFWAKQVISESLGKQNFGITFLPSRGTEDQHSQLELFLGGCEDKFFKMYLKIYAEQYADQKQSEMQKMFQAQGENVYNSLIKFNKNAKIVKFENIDEEFISKNMINLYITTIAIAKFVGINPFNQPIVEEIKKWTKKQTT